MIGDPVKFRVEYETWRDIPSRPPRVVQSSEVWLAGGEVTVVVRDEVAAVWWLAALRAVLPTTDLVRTAVTALSAWLTTAVVIPEGLISAEDIRRMMSEPGVISHAAHEGAKTGVATELVRQIEHAADREAYDAMLQGKSDLPARGAR